MIIGQCSETACFLWSTLLCDKNQKILSLGRFDANRNNVVRYVTLCNVLLLLEVRLN